MRGSRTGADPGEPGIDGDTAMALDRGVSDAAGTASGRALSSLTAALHRPTPMGA